MPLPLRQLEAFHAVVVSGNMTNAAKYLNISQPAVSRLVASLEETLGFALFQRLSGQLRATPEARVLFGEVERALNNLNHISRLTEDIQERKAGHLRIACLPGFATTLLPRVLATFLAERPGLKLTLEPRTPERILEWIASQQFDLGLSESFEKNPAIEFEPIRIRTVCVAPRGHPIEARRTVSAKDLDGLPLIHTNRNHPIYRSLQQAFDEAGAVLNGVVETRQFAPACIMVAEGFGVSVVSELDARVYESEGLVIRRFEPEIPFPINILYPAYMPRSIATLEFIEVFREELKPFILDD